MVSWTGNAVSCTTSGETPWRVKQALVSSRVDIDARFYFVALHNNIKTPGIRVHTFCVFKGIYSSTKVFLGYITNWFHSVRISLCNVHSRTRCVVQWSCCCRGYNLILLRGTPALGNSEEGKKNYEVYREILFKNINCIFGQFRLLLSAVFRCYKILHSSTTYGATTYHLMKANIFLLCDYFLR